MVIYICIKFQENISNSFQVTEWTKIYYRNHHFQSSKGHISKYRLIRVTVLVFCTLCHNASHSCEVSSKYLKGFQLTVQTQVHSRNGYFQYQLCSKDHNSKSRLTRVMVLCSACCLTVLYTCEKFHNYTSHGFQLTEQTRVHNRNGYVQNSKAITPKIGEPELRIMCSACCLILSLHCLYICVKFS